MVSPVRTADHHFVKRALRVLDDHFAALNDGSLGPEHIKQGFRVLNLGNGDGTGVALGGVLFPRSVR